MGVLGMGDIGQVQAFFNLTDLITGDGSSRNYPRHENPILQP